VKVGDSVVEGQDVAVTEAMKMEAPVKSPASGLVIAINIKPGDSVSAGQVIMYLE
jgi:biotin carboxyl carrier protein